MEKERRIKALGIVALIVVVLGLTIAFAALSQTLTINGSAYLDAAKWGIKFQNLTEPEKVGDANTTGTAAIEEDVSINNINVSLSTPGDSVTYGVELVNEGTINAKIEKIDKPELTNEQQRYLDFTVKDNKGNELTEGEILNAGETKVLTIKIEFKKDIEKEDLPTSVSNITLSYKLNFVQTDDKKETTTSPVVENNCTKFDKKDTYNVGDVIALCNEKTGVSEDFYVMKDNGNTVTALAKYNIYTNTNENHLTFSNTNYWADSDGNLLPKYGSNYSADIYDSNSNLYEPIQNYKDYLKNDLNKASVSARLITYNEVIDLGCSCDKSPCSCTSAPSWLYSVDYWTATAFSEVNLWTLRANSSAHLQHDGRSLYYAKGYYGIRPVITISKSEL